MYIVTILLDNNISTMSISISSDILDMKHNLKSIFENIQNLNNELEESNIDYMNTYHKDIHTENTIYEIDEIDTDMTDNKTF